MIEQNINTILQIATLLGIIFAVYLYFRKPQEELDKRQALTDKDVQSKTNILSEQFQWEREASEKKFIEFGKRLDDAFLLASNHTNTVDVKVDKLIASVNSMSNEITRLSTIIEERIPKKQ